MFLQCDQYKTTAYLDLAQYSYQLQHQVFDKENCTEQNNPFHQPMCSQMLKVFAHFAQKFQTNVQLYN